MTVREFLEEENILEEWIINAEAEGHCIDDLNVFLNDDSLSSLGGAFTWGKTPEGVIFWMTKVIEYNNVSTSK